MFTSRWIPRDATRMVLWLIALMSVAATAAIYQSQPGWVPMMRSVSCAGSVVAIVLLWMPVWKRWIARRWNSRP